MRNLTGSQCNRLRIGRERLNRGALVTTLSRQFWTPCNLAICFSGILWKSELQWSNLLLTSATAICLARSKDRLFRIWHRSWIWKKHALHVWDMCLQKFRLLSNSTPRFLADVDGLVSWPRSKHGKLFKNFSRWSLVPIEEILSC